MNTNNVILRPHEAAREEVVYLAISPKFAQKISDVMGPKSLHTMHAETDISVTYLQAMRKGHVPSEEIIAQFCERAELSPAMIKEIFDAAAEARPNVTPESLMHVACHAAGMTNMERLEVLAVFRKQLESAAEQSDETGTAGQ